MKTASKKSLKLDRAPVYISKEDAVEIALETRTSCEIDWHEFDDDDFHRALNLAIAKVIGEPVGYTRENYKGVMEAYGDTVLAHSQDNLRNIPLYAIKELPND